MLIKPPRSFDSITDLILAHGYAVEQVDGEDYFVKPSQEYGGTAIRFSAAEIQKHNTTTFYEKAVLRGWFSHVTD